MAASRIDELLFFLDTVQNKSEILCDKCGITFTQKKNLHAHMRNIHGENPDKDSGNKVCPERLCAEKFKTMTQLQSHLTEVHGAELAFSEQTFYGKDDFLEWKIKMEKDSNSSFFLRSEKVKDGATFSYYACHRSLLNVRRKNEKAKKMIRRRITPSIKSDSTCPAMIKVFSLTINGITEIKVNFQSKHIGHDLDASKLRWKRKKRVSLGPSVHVEDHMVKVLKETSSCSSTKRFRLTHLKLHHSETKVESNDVSDLCESKTRNPEEGTANLPTLSKSPETAESLKKEITANLMPELVKKIKHINSIELLKILQRHFNTVNACLDSEIAQNKLPVRNNKHIQQT